MSDMKLSRIVPAHKKTIKFRWVQAFQAAGYLNKVRAQAKMTLFPSCYWCKQKFADDELTYLAQSEKGANRLLCVNCAAELDPQIKTPLAKNDER